MNRKTLQSRQLRLEKRPLHRPVHAMASQAQPAQSQRRLSGCTTSSHYRVISCPLLPSPPLLSEGSAGDFFAVSVQVETWTEPVTSPRMLPYRGRQLARRHLFRRSLHVVIDCHARI